MSEFSHRRVNELTRRAHRRQTFWQILLPVLLGMLVAITLILLIVRGGAGSIERSAQTATILLAIPMMAAGLLFLVAITVSSLLLGRLMHWLPPYSFRAQRMAQKLSSSVSQVSRAAERPFLLLESWGDALSRVFQRIR